MNSRPAMIVRSVVRPSWTDEERVAQARGLEHVEVLPQLHVFGELVEAIGGRRNLGVGGPDAAAAAAPCPDTSPPPRRVAGWSPDRAGFPRGTARRTSLPARRGSPSAPANPCRSRRSASRASCRRPAPWPRGGFPRPPVASDDRSTARRRPFLPLLRGGGQRRTQARPPRTRRPRASVGGGRASRRGVGRPATARPRPACPPGSRRGRHDAGSCRWRSWARCPP